MTLLTLRIDTIGRVSNFLSTLEEMHTAKKSRFKPLRSGSRHTLIFLFFSLRFVEALDEKSGASLKLTVLNPHGTIWLMVAGGGASVIFTDSVADLGRLNQSKRCRKISFFIPSFSV